MAFSQASNDLASAHSSGYDQQMQIAYDEECCPGVVDPLSLLTTLGAIAAGTYFFRQLILTQVAATGRSFQKRSMRVAPEDEGFFGGLLRHIRPTSRSFQNRSSAVKESGPRRDYNIVADMFQTGKL